MCEEWRHRNLGRALRPCFAKHASKELKTPAPQKRKEKASPPPPPPPRSHGSLIDFLTSSSSSDLSLCLSFFLYLERKTTNKNKKQKEKDVNPSKEEVDEGFQEASAGSTCWYQWSPSRQQHHALERCYFWVPVFFLSFFLSFFFSLVWFLIFVFCYFVDLMILLGMEVGNSDSCFFFSFLITLYNFIFCFLCYWMMDYGWLLINWIFLTV